MDTLTDYWDWIVEMGFATAAELTLVTCINGYTESTLNDVLFTRTGYRSRQQLKDCEGL